MKSGSDFQIVRYRSSIKLQCLFFILLFCVAGGFMHFNWIIKLVAAIYGVLSYVEVRNFNKISVVYRNI